MNRWTPTFLAVATLTIAQSTQALAGQPPIFELGDHDLGPFNSTAIGGVNNFGEATGRSGSDSFERWTAPFGGEGVAVLPIPEGFDSAFARAIADTGAIAGTAFVASEGGSVVNRNYVAFAAPMSDEITILSHGPFEQPTTTSFVSSISPDGRIIAGWQGGSGVPGNLATVRPTLWIDGVWTDAGDNALVFFTIGGVNNAGDMVATGRIQSGPNIRRAYVRQNGAWRDLGTLGGDEAFALDINESGVVTGRAEDATGQFFPFRWDPDTETMTKLFMPPGYRSGGGEAINSRGDVVGFGNSNGSGQDAIAWPAGSQFGFRVIDRVDSSEWIDLERCLGINDCGVVIGTGQRSGVPGSSEGWITQLPPSQLGQSVTTDTDGDAIPDCWETYGVDIDLDGQPELDLPAMGANPQRQDIFVEVDAMTSRAPAPNVLSRVEAAFANAPIENPDGTTGVTLHAMLDETNLTLRDYPNAFVEFQADKMNHFGTPAERVATNATAILQARRQVFRYCIFANTYEGSTSSGLGEFPGNDFMVTLGAWEDGAGGFGGTPDEQAGTFMHELGHTLGLDHGGGDGVNYKPNYLSVMNYIWQTPNSSFASQWELDYSCFQFASINEAALIDVNPLGFTPERPMPQKYADREIVWGDGAETSGIRRAFVGETIIWNGLSTPAPVNAPYTHDLTRAWDTFAESPARHETLHGYNDWANLDLNFRDDPSFADGVSLTPDCMLTTELHDHHESLPVLGAGPTPCSTADLAPPFTTLDIADVIEFLQRFSMNNPTVDYAPPAGVFEIGDVIAFLQLFGAGCS